MQQEAVVEETVQGAEESPKSEEDDSSISSLLQEVVAAQGNLEGQDSVKGLKKHIAAHLYPLLSKTIGFMDELGATFKELADEALAQQDEYLSDENIQFLNSYFGIVNNFVLQLAPEAQYRAENGDASLLNELRALSMATNGAMEVMKSFSMDEDVEEGDEGDEVSDG